MIGAVHLNDGLNQDLRVTVDPAKATPVMYAILHLDKGVMGKYEFPGPDALVFGDPSKTAPSFKATIAQPPNVIVVPSVSVRDQDIGAGVVVIDQVISTVPGWIAIHPQGAEDASDVTLGYLQVKEGTSTSLRVNIDNTKATGVLYAMLHIDTGVPGMYEFPNADPPVVVNGIEVSVSFRVTVNGQTLAAPAVTNPPPAATPTTAPAPSTTPTPQAAKPTLAAATPTPAVGDMPTIIVGDQAIENKTVTVSEVLINKDAWLAIRRLNGDGNMGAIAGYTHLAKGLNQNIAVTVDTTITSDILVAQILEDNGVPGKLEVPTPDIPLVVNGVTAAKTFKVIRFSDGGTVMGVYPDPINGAHLVVNHAQSVYSSANDAPGQSNCTGDCLKLWQPVIMAGRVVYSVGVQKDKLGFLKMPNGSVWLTYNGYPLYTYVHDLKPGDANGEGGSWSLVVP